MLTPVAIGPGEQVEVAITGLDNPAVPGPAMLSVSTSSDGPRSASYTITGLGIPVAALSVALSTPAAGATKVTYTVDFTPSANGGLAADWGTIRLSGPAGTFPVAAPCGLVVATVTNLGSKASGQDDFCSAKVSASGAEAQLSTPVTIGAGQRAQVAISGLDNPAAPGRQTLTFSTSSNSARSASYRIVPGTAVVGASVVLSNAAAGAVAVTYAVGFTAPRSGALVASSSTITLSAAPGTFLPPAMCDQQQATVSDLTTKVSATASSCFGATPAKRPSFGVVVPLEVAAGDRVVLTVSGLSNPRHAGPQSLSLTTSSSGVAAKVPFVTLAAGPISGHIGDTSGNAVAGAEVQACLPKGGQCYDTSSTPSGNFKEAVPYGRYTLTAFPPAETSLAQSTSSRSWAVSGPAGVAGANVTMPVLQPLPAGVSIGGQDGGVPVLYSGGPAPMTVRGCPHGVGAVEVRGTNDLTGKQAVILVPLLESPRVRATTRRPSPQYGRYTATSRSPMTSTVSRR